jgi:hypothetical protein
MNNMRTWQTYRSDDRALRRVTPESRSTQKLGTRSRLIVTDPLGAHPDYFRIADDTSRVLPPLGLMNKEGLIANIVRMVHLHIRNGKEPCG